MISLAQHLERMHVRGSPVTLSQQLSSSAALKPWYTVWEAMLPRRVTRSPAAGRDGSDQRTPRSGSGKQGLTAGGQARPWEPTASSGSAASVRSVR